LASAAIFSLLAADSAWGLASGSRYNSRSYQRRAAPSYSSAPASSARTYEQRTRRYSFTPSSGATSSSYNYAPPPSLGKNRYYRPGPGYAPSRGINSADFKIKGL
jgi:hypothetical protein